ncbi:M23 family metallopeptidase [Haladaptatus sp. W1]|uniref:M23 family metallopeptidase n=1 Tax=Haladaptatus sp. W1 TaxID=1897478 RepID=UPI000A63F149|nr:M23 family metallopeptidase [Haladaptatus sp. W1]
MRGFLPSFGEDEEDPTDWVAIGGKSYTRRSRLSLLLLQLNPFVFVQGVLQLVGHVPTLLRYRGRLPNPDRFEQATTYRLPFADSTLRDDSTDDADGGTAPTDGKTWTVINGGPTRERSHSWSILAQRYALDFVITDEEGRTHTGDGSRPDQYYCYGEPIRAPADGVVVAAHDGHRDGPRAGGWLDLRQRNILGNWIIIEHADSEYSVSAHLQRGSIAVSEGERVERGQQIGRCGHSGNSTEPTFTSTSRTARTSTLGWDCRFGSRTSRPTRRTTPATPATFRWASGSPESGLRRTVRSVGVIRSK